MILEQCKGVHCVGLGESFPRHIFLQNLTSIQPITSLVKFALHGARTRGPSCPDVRRAEAVKQDMVSLRELIRGEELVSFWRGRTRRVVAKIGNISANFRSFSAV